MALIASLAEYWLSVLRNPRYFSMIDSRVYRAGAQVLLHGGRLYAMRATGARLQFTYPPAAAVLFSWMPAVGVWWTKMASTVFSQASLIACVWLMLAWLRVPRHLNIGIAGLVGAGALWFEPVQATLHFGQINLLIMLLVVADLSRRPRWLPPGLLIGAATGLKLVPAIFVLYLVLTGRRRAALTAIGTVLGSIALGFAVTPGQSAAYWGRLAFDTGRVGSVAHVSNQSLLGLLSRLAGSPANAHSAWLAAAITLTAVGSALAAALHHIGDDIAGALACACTGLAVSPISWNHHWVWAVPVAIVLGHRAWQTRSAALGVALLAWVMVFSSGVIWHVPRSYGREFRWRGWQLLAGNAYILAGLTLLFMFAARMVLRVACARGGPFWSLRRIDGS